MSEANRSTRTHSAARGCGPLSQLQARKKKMTPRRSGEHLHSGDIGSCKTFIKRELGPVETRTRSFPFLHAASIVGLANLAGRRDSWQSSSDVCLHQLDITRRRLTASITANILRQCNFRKQNRNTTPYKPTSAVKADDGWLMLSIPSRDFLVWEIRYLTPTACTLACG